MPSTSRAPEGDLRGQHAGAAPEVEHAFAGLRVEQVDQRRALRGHVAEAAVVGATFHRSKLGVSYRKTDQLSFIRHRAPVAVLSISL